MTAMGSMPTARPSAGCSSFRFQDDLTGMKGIVKDLIRRRWFFLLSGLYVVSFGTDAGPYDWPHVGSLVSFSYLFSRAVLRDNRHDGVFDVYRLLPVSRWAYLRSMWLVSVALPAAMCIIHLLAIAITEPRAHLREGLLSASIQATFFSALFVVAIPLLHMRQPYTTRTGLSDALSSILFVAAILALKTLAASDTTLMLCVLCGVLSCTASFLRCNATMPKKPFGKTAIAERTSVATPRFSSRCRAAFLPLEDAGWRTALCVVWVLIPPALFGDRCPDLFFWLAWYPPFAVIHHLACTTDANTRLIRMLPMSYPARLLLLWPIPMCAGLAFYAVGALTAALTGHDSAFAGTGAVTGSIAASCVWFAILLFLPPRLRDFFNAIGVILLAVCLARSATHPATQSGLGWFGFFAGATGFVVLALLLPLCEVVTDVGGKTRWTHHTCTADTVHKQVISLSNISRLKKGLIVACLLLVMAWFPFRSNHGLVGRFFPEWQAKVFTNQSMEKPK